MRLAAAVVLVVMLAAGCGRPAPAASFVSPGDGAVVSSPVRLVLRATGARVEPAGPIHARAGHFHVMVDRACVRPDLPIEKTEPGYEHLGGGDTEMRLTLSPGVHRLCVQLGDGAHVAFGRSQRITIRVK